LDVLELDFQRLELKFDYQSMIESQFMNTQTQTQNRSETVGRISFASDRSPAADTALGFAVIGFLAAGAVGILKALSMPSGIDVLLCLLGSAIAFGAVFYIYSGKD
jgi:hypothetical protein